jgi:hypothetical protein
MCNLYRLKGSQEEAENLFGAKITAGANFGEEVYPRYSGLVVADRVASVMTGFPLRLRISKPKAVTNARDDKLLTPNLAAQLRKAAVPHSGDAIGRGQRSLRQDDADMVQLTRHGGVRRWGHRAVA